MRLKKQALNTVNSEEKIQLTKQAKKILKQLELDEDYESEEKISSILELLLEKED